MSVVSVWSNLEASFKKSGKKDRREFVHQLFNFESDDKLDYFLDRLNEKFKSEGRAELMQKAARILTLFKLGNTFQDVSMDSESFIRETDETELASLLKDLIDTSSMLVETLISQKDLLLLYDSTSYWAVMEDGRATIHSRPILQESDIYAFQSKDVTELILGKEKAEVWDRKTIYVRKSLPSGLSKYKVVNIN